jgi:hypothetical protein
MPKHTILLEALLVLAIGCHGRPSPFTAVEYDPSHLPKRDVEVPTGRYGLRVFAESGTCKGSMATGVLTLHRTSDGDRSPRTGEGPTPRDVRKPALWGFTDVDWHSVCAPLETSRRADVYPGPMSQDPIYPGVVGLFNRVDGYRRPVLVVGADLNRAGKQLHVDGAGIALRIERVGVGSTTFDGVWNAYGIVANGSGTWHAWLESSPREAPPN